MTFHRSRLGISGALILVSAGGLSAGAGGCSSDVRVFGTTGSGGGGTAGHGGASGRYDAYHETAFDYAFMLWQMGITN